MLFIQHPFIRGVRGLAELIYMQKSFSLLEWLSTKKSFISVISHEEKEENMGSIEFQVFHFSKIKSQRFLFFFSLVHHQSIQNRTYSFYFDPPKAGSLSELNSLFQHGNVEPKEIDLGDNFRLRKRKAEK